MNVSSYARTEKRQPSEHFRRDGTPDLYARTTHLIDELGGCLKPLHYDLHLILPEVNKYGETFEGYVTILLYVKKKTNKIALHADPNFINIRAIFFRHYYTTTIKNTDNDNSWIQIKPENFEERLGLESHIVEITAPCILHPKQHLKILLLFDGKCSDDSKGLHILQGFCDVDPDRKSEVNTLNKNLSEMSSNLKEGVTVYHSEESENLNFVTRTITTILFPMYTRRLFPCLDLIHLKATISLAISLPIDTLIPSHLPELSVLASGELHRTYYSEFPPLFQSAHDIVPFPLNQKITEIDSFPCTTYSLSPLPSKKTQSSNSIHLQPIISTDFMNSFEMKSHCFPTKHSLFDRVFVSSTSTEDYLDPNDNKKYYTTFLFEKTPIIPCHTLGFTIGHLNKVVRFVACNTRRRSSIFLNSTNKIPSIRTKTDRTIRVTVWHLPGPNTNCCRFGLWIASECLRILNELLYKIPYPIDKLDLIILPLNTRIVGIENFGCILFNTEFFFVDEQTHRTTVLHIARMICYKVASMWFGNLIVPCSFDHAWLTEGIAQYIAFWILHQVLTTKIALPIQTSFFPNRPTHLTHSKYSLTKELMLNYDPYVDHLFAYFCLTENFLWGVFAINFFWEAILADDRKIIMPSSLKPCTYPSFVQFIEIGDYMRTAFDYSAHSVAVRGVVSSQGLQFAFRSLLPSPRGTRSNTDKPSLSHLTQPELEPRQPVPIQSPIVKASSDTPIVVDLLPLESQGLLTTADIEHKLLHLSFGKPECIVHSFATRIGGHQNFIEMIHLILQRRCLLKLPEKDSFTCKETVLRCFKYFNTPQLKIVSQSIIDENFGLLLKEDIWDAATALLQKEHLSEIYRTMDSDVSAKNETPIDFQSLFNSVITTGGYARVGLILEKPEPHILHSGSFSISLHIYQLPPPHLYSTAMKHSSAETWKKNTSTVSTVVQNYQSVVKEMNKSDSQTINDPIHPCSPFQVPIEYFINGEENRILVGDKPETIIIKKIMDSPLSHRQLDIPFSLIMNYNLNTFCTIHPQNETAWLAILRGIGSPGYKPFGDRDVITALMIILEDARYHLAVCIQLFKEEKSNTAHCEKEGWELLKQLLINLGYFYTALSSRLTPIQQPIKSGKTGDDQLTSYTCLMALHIMLDLLNWLPRAATKRPGMPQAHIEASNICEAYMEAKLLHPNVLMSCKIYLSTYTVPQDKTELERNDNILFRNKPYISETIDQKNAFSPNSFTIQSIDQSSKLSTSPSIINRAMSLENKILPLEEENDLNQEKKACEPKGYISGSEIIKVLRELNLVTKKTLRNTRNILAMLLDIGSAHY